MLIFIIRRFFTLIPFLLAVTLLTSLLMALSPGDFLTPIKAQPDIPAERIEDLEREFGLDRPWVVQYFLWLGNAVTLDFGYSWTYKQDVSDIIGDRVFATFLLSLTSILFAWTIAIPLGVLAAMYKDSIFDRISAFLAYSALSIPEFFLALLAVYFAAISGWFPMSGATSVDYEYLSPLAQLADRLYHLILPTFVLGIGSIASIMRVMRANFLDQIRADFVRTARAKGLRENVVMFKHVLRNAINPLISSFGFAFSSLLSGALIVENIMNYPGLGSLIYQGFLREDRFLVLASITLSCVMLILGNLVADILLAKCDPRIRLEAKS